jgi:hypothetical protein
VIRATQLAVTLVGVFLAAHYELENLERKLTEERKKEVRQQKTKILDYVESWLEGVSSAMQDITVLRELGEKDKSDGALIVPAEKWRPIAEKLLRLEANGFIVLAKLADIDNKELIEKFGLVWFLLDKPNKHFAEGKVIGTEPFLTRIADAIQILEKVRSSELEQGSNARAANTHTPTTHGSRFLARLVGIIGR